MEQNNRVGNVSPEADAEFVRLLQKEDSKRYEILMRNMRADVPNVRMSEHQALTNFMLGLPTGQWRFEIIAGITKKNPAPVPVNFEPKSKFKQTSFRPATADRGGRPRKFKTNAERQKAFRADSRLRKSEFKDLPQNVLLAFGNPVV